MCWKYIGLSNLTNNIQNRDSPSFNYCNFLLVKITQQDAECLQKAPKLCFPYNPSRGSSDTHSIYIDETLNMCTLHELSPPHLPSVFEYVHQTHERHKRLAASMQLNIYSKEEHWVLRQKIPYSIRTATSLDVFKTVIKNLRIT